MAGRWNTSPLDELVDSVVDRRGVTPLKLGSDFVTKGYRVISAKLIKDGRIDLSADEPRFVDEPTYKRWMRTPLLADDVILTSEAPIGEVAYIREPVEWCLGQRLFGIRTNKSRLHGRFLYYALQSDGVCHDLHSRATGTTAEGIRQSELRLVQIPLPDVDQQRAIAHILGSLDDKIELNRRMNATLEAMARAIFKSWFVDFDPVRAKSEGRDPGLPTEIADLFPESFEDSELGEIPTGWEVAEIGQVAEVIDCLHSRKPERREKGFPLLQLWNIRDGGLIDMTDTYWVDEADYRKWVSRVEASPGDCVITNVGRVGAVGQIPVGLKAALGRNMTAIRCRSAFSFPTFLLECLLSQAMRNEIELRVDTGTILDALNVRSIPNLRFVRAPTSVVKRFEAKARPLRAQMEQHHAECRTLAAVRDTLLPRLVSGELRIRQAEAVAAQVG